MKYLHTMVRVGDLDAALRFYRDTLRLELLPALSHRINTYRYDDGDVFSIHIDGDWPGYGLSPDCQRMLEWPARRSCLSMRLNLNADEDGMQGCATRLCRPKTRLLTSRRSRTRRCSSATALHPARCAMWAAV